MASRILYILIEGDDDERFFESIIKPIYEEKGFSVKFWKYAGKKKKKVINFLKSINSMNADYIFITDINKTPCISVRKQKIKNKFKGLDEDKMVVVIKEIESWYLAGLNDKFLKDYKIPSYPVTDNITKEQFNDYIPKKFDSKIDFMMEILKHFSIEKAQQRNKSFSYFLRKYDCDL